MLLPRSHPSTLRDRLWVWGHHPGSHDGYGLPRRSRMTPAEGAFYLGLPNLLMVRFGLHPQPPFDQLAISFRPLERVVWSLVGSGGRTSPEERESVLQLCAGNPNIRGVVLDDFWSGGPEQNGGVVLGVQETRDLASRVRGLGLDVWGVLYTSEIHRWERVEAYLNCFDHLTLWYWDPAEIDKAPFYMRTLRERAPDKRLYLGSYLWDFGNCRPLPDGHIERQLEIGRAAIRSGDFEGMVFIGSPVLDVGLASVETLRRWIQDRGGESP